MENLNSTLYNLNKNFTEIDKYKNNDSIIRILDEIEGNTDFIKHQKYLLDNIFEEKINISRVLKLFLYLKRNHKDEKITKKLQYCNNYSLDEESFECIKEYKNTLLRGNFKIFDYIDDLEKILIEYGKKKFSINDLGLIIKKIHKSQNENNQDVYLINKVFYTRKRIIGRIFPKSLNKNIKPFGFMNSDIRKYISDGIEFDICNCYPAIIYNLSKFYKSKDIENKNTYQYVSLYFKKRDKIVKKFIRNSLKKLNDKNKKMVKYYMITLYTYYTQVYNIFLQKKIIETFPKYYSGKFDKNIFDNKCLDDNETHIKNLCFYKYLLFFKSEEIELLKKNKVYVFYQYEFYIYSSVYNKYVLVEETCCKINDKLYQTINNFCNPFIEKEYKDYEPQTLNDDFKYKKLIYNDNNNFEINFDSFEFNKNFIFGIVNDILKLTNVLSNKFISKNNKYIVNDMKYKNKKNFDLKSFLPLSFMSYLLQINENIIMSMLEYELNKKNIKNISFIHDSFLIHDYKNLDISKFDEDLLPKNCENKFVIVSSFIKNLINKIYDNKVIDLIPKNLEKSKIDIKFKLDKNLLEKIIES